MAVTPLAPSGGAIGGGPVGVAVKLGIHAAANSLLAIRVGDGSQNELAENEVSPFDSGAEIHASVKCGGRSVFADYDRTPEECFRQMEGFGFLGLVERGQTGGFGLGRGVGAEGKQGGEYGQYQTLHLG